MTNIDKVCPTCKGTGIVGIAKKTYPGEYHDMRNIETFKFKCPQCGGTGTVQPPKPNEIADEFNKKYKVCPTCHGSGYVNPMTTPAEATSTKWGVTKCDIRELRIKLEDVWPTLKEVDGRTTYKDISAYHEQEIKALLPAIVHLIESAQIESYKRGKLDGHAAQHAKDLDEATLPNPDIDMLSTAYLVHAQKDAVKTAVCSNCRLQLVPSLIGGGLFCKHCGKIRTDLKGKE